MRKRITTWVLVIVLVVSLLPGAALAVGFTDVPAASYYAEAVNWAVEKNITRGTSENTFSPENTCTRGQVVTFMWRAAGEPDPQLTGTAFQDVNTDDYYGKAVQWAVENNITKGTSATTFSPEQGCTRGQVVTFLYRSENEPVVSGANRFSDVSSNDYYADAVKWAVERDITKGTSNSTFSPNETCTRAQIVTFLYAGFSEVAHTRLICGAPRRLYWNGRAVPPECALRSTGFCRGCKAGRLRNLIFICFELLPVVFWC